MKCTYYSPSIYFLQANSMCLCCLREKGRFSPPPDAAVDGPAEKGAPDGGVVRRPRLHRLLPLPRHELDRSDAADGARGLDAGQFGKMQRGLA